MNCASCGHVNPERAKFCLECGAPVAPRCASCGTELPAAAKFCLECGTPTTARSSEPAGSRKVVTIVFADLVGSTSLHERLDAESARRFMESYYSAMRGAVETHGGTVTQLLGDGVKAVFGIPRVAEDDAIRAVRAAVEMQRAFRALAEQQAGAVGKTGLRVAVNTGEVVANDASEIIGDPVNVAARLQEQGKDGDVVIGEATQALVSKLVTLDLLGRFALKGRTEAVSAYRVVSLDRPAGAAATAFVGRDAELARITAVYEAAIAAPGARLAVLLGSPGLGKSRLIDEFARRLGETATVLRAQCEASGGASFAPLAEALRALPGLDEALPAGDAERARVVEGIRLLLAGSPASPEETFYVVRRLLGALAVARPVVLVIDDLHWAEPLLLDLVEHLVQWVRDSPLLVLVGARPELRDTRSSLATSGGAVAELITLAGLDAGAATRLAANIVGAADLPAAVAAKVLATSEGNPLFVGELVRMLVHEGALKQEGDRWITGTALAELEMPPTIHALLAARIERLRPEDRTVLERAAVVGRSFSRSAVAELLPREVTDLDAHLESLRRSELVEPDTGWFLGEPALRFHHLLIRDAAYRRLLKGTRAELHGRFADWIEARTGGSLEHDETIGWHLEQAHQHLRELGPLDARGQSLGERAARLLAAAGRRALARDDLPLAAGLLGRALARLDADDPARADLALDWCEALLSAGDVGPAAAAIDELGRFVGDSDRLRAWHTCFTGQLTALTAPQALRATVDAVTGAAATLASLDDAAGEAKAHFVHAQAYARLGKVGACEAALDRALAAARRAGDRRRANAVLAGAPLAALWGPSPVTRASGRCLDVVRVLRISQEAPAVEAVALSCQGVLEALRGRTEAARRMVASSRRMVEELGITHRLLEVDVFAGRIDLLEGDPVAAERRLRIAYDGLRDLGLGIDAAQAAALLARAMLAQGRDSEAETLSHESETLAGDDLRAAIAWRGVRAEALARRGEHAAAVELAQAAIAMAAATDALLDHADARLALAATLRAAGRLSEAEAEERRAIELWEAKGATLLAERARDAESRTVSVERPPDAHAERTRPIRRRVRGNAATASAARYDAAIAARDEAALHDIFAEGAQSVHHPTGAVYDRATGIASARAMFKAENLRFETLPLATLGDSLALCRIGWSASGISTRSFDVGAYESESIVLIEVDAQGRRVRLEQFAVDRLGDAIARLYERYAETLAAGPERTHAATAARSVATLLLMEVTDPERLRTALAPDLEHVDRRSVGLGITRGNEDFLRTRGALILLTEALSDRVDDVLDLRSDIGLVRVTSSGTDRASGGAFERPYLLLVAVGSDGLVSRLEQFDVDREAEALARFDALRAETTRRRQTVRRRVRANAATAHAEREDAAFAARDDDAIARLFAGELEVVDHPNGATLDRLEFLTSVRPLLYPKDLTRVHETLASLGDALALCRLSLSAGGIARGDFDVGAYEYQGNVLIEVDAQGRCRRVEIFAADHLGNAIARLYERHAELLPEGPERTLAVATARSVATLVRFDLPAPERFWTTLAPDLEHVDRRVVGLGAQRGIEAFLRGAEALRKLSDGATTWYIEDILDLRSNAGLVRATISGIDRASGGAYERPFLLILVVGPVGLVSRLEQLDVDRQVEAFARFDALIAAPETPPPSVRRRVRANAATAIWARWDAFFAARDVDALAALWSDSFELTHHPTAATWGRDGALDSTRRLLRAQDASYRHEVLAGLGDSLALVRGSVAASGTGWGRFDVGAYEHEEFILSEIDEHGRFRALEVFAADHLGDAIARLYERYAELLQEGPERARALATAHSAAAMLGQPDLPLWATVIAPDIEFLDPRSVGLGSMHGAEALMRSIRSLFDLTDDIVTRIDDVLGLRNGALLVRWTNTGTVRASGGAFERNFCLLWVFGADGLLSRWEQRDVDREAEAFARFDALTAEPPTKLRRVRSNAATEHAAKIDATIASRDADTLSTLFADESEAVDHTTGTTWDRQGLLGTWRSLLRARDPACRHEPLATLGDSLALCRTAISTSGFAGQSFDVGAYENETTSVIEADSQAGRRRSETFAPGQLGNAIARLYERYAELLPDGLARARAAATARSIAASLLIAGRDVERLRSALAPDLEHVDRRTVGLGTTGGAEAFLRAVDVLWQLSEDLTLRVDDILDLRANAVLMHVTTSGIDRTSGGAFERPFLLLLAFGVDGLVSRWEQLDVEREAEALARIDELTAKTEKPSPAQRRVRQNAVTALWARFDAAFAARDDDALVDCYSESFETADHSTGTTYGRGGVLDSVRRFQRSGDAELRHDALATLGESLALARRSTSASGTGGGRFYVGAYERQGIMISEVDFSGRFSRSEHFSSDRMGDGVVRLYEWYADAQPERAARVRAAAIARSVAAMLATPDLERRATAFAPGIEFVDHRIVGVGSMRGADAVLRAIGALHDLVENVGTRLDDVIDLRADSMVLCWTHFGTTRDGGGSFERSLAHLWIFGADGLLIRWEQSEGERVDELLGRYDALLPTPPASGFENAAARAMLAFERSWRARDWAGARATYDDAHQMDDRRKLMRLSVSGETFFANERMLFEDTASEWRSELVATRGERLALFRVTFTATVAGSGPMEVEMLDLVEVDAAGRRIALVVFDIDDMDAAYAELDARFDAGEARQHPHEWAATREMARALGSRDWSALHALSSRFRTHQDHRQLGFGTLSGDERLAVQRALFDLAPDAQYRFDHVRLSERGCLRQMMQTGTRDGGPFENPGIVVNEFDATGKILSIDVYDTGAFEQAFARLEAIGAAQVPRAEPFANAASRSWQQRNAAWVAQDWKRLAQLTPIGFRCLDRRRMFLLDLDREQYLEFARSLGERRSTRLDSQVLATRGDRLALTRDRTVVSDAEVGPSESERLSVVEANERGEAVAIVRLDPDDLDAAYAELDARFDAGEPASHGRALAWRRAMTRALSTRELDTALDTAAPDLVAHDHRAVGWGTLKGPAAWVATLRSLVDLAPDVQVRFDHVRTCHAGQLFQGAWHGTRDGGAFEIPIAGVVELDGQGKMRRFDLYEPSQVDRALARFAELAPDPLRIPPNAAMRTSARSHAGFAARDWAVQRTLVSDGFIWEDRGRRALIRGDIEMWISSMQFNATLPGFQGELDPMGTVGDRLLVERMIWSGGRDGAEFENVRARVVEVDAAGKLRAMIFYDAEDRREAFAEAQRRFLVGEAAGCEGQAPITALVSAIGRHDWDALRESLAPDAVICDRRALAILGEIDREQWIDSLRALADLAPDMDWELSRILSWNRHGRLCVGRLFGSTRDAGPFENAIVAILLTHGDRVQRYELFDIADGERALACFEELCASRPESAK